MERRYSNGGSGSGEIKFEIEEHVCTIAETESGWTKELQALRDGLEEDMKYWR